MSHDIITNHDTQQPDFNKPDGGLRPLIGTTNIQVLRANREQPALAEGSGWTYNHQPYLAYWNKTFYLEYLSNPAAEHEGPGQTLLVTSKNGLHWGKPEVIFPPYPVEDGLYSIMHQRMGFYRSSDDRLLVLACYASPCPYPWPPKWDMPNDGRGMGRVVREIHKDGSLSPIYFIRYHRHAGWHEGNTNYPFYQKSEDTGFVEACDELLADKLMTQQWWEEDRAQDGFFTMADQKAFCFYHRADGKAVGLGKQAKASLSEDEGHSWQPISDLETFITGGQKMWGQRTADGKYAVVYTPDTWKRYPLAIVSGEDGEHFDNLLCVHGQVPPMRYSGFCKDRGPQYVRGIAEGNGQPDADSLWLTYSMNKEDIIATRVPLPLRYTEENPIHETFKNQPMDGFIRDWNIITGQWAKAQVIQENAKNRCLELRDSDPYNTAVAARVFPQCAKAELSFRIQPKQTECGWLEIEVLDQHSNIPLRLIFDNRGFLQGSVGEERHPLKQYTAQQWHNLRITLDCKQGIYNLWMDGEQIADDKALLVETSSVERISFRTGPTFGAPQPQAAHLAAQPDLPNSGIQVKEAVYWVDDVKLGKIL